MSLLIVTGILRLYWLSLWWVFMIASTEGKKVAVIGGGAAGYFAAIQCAEILKQHSSECQVVLMEATPSPLSKVLISGGGRCNVMHDPTKPIDVISKGYPRGRLELLGPFNAVFGPRETFQWFSSRGVEMKTEPDGRVFPTTDRSSTIVETLRSAATSAGVQIYCGRKITDISLSTKTMESSDFSDDKEKDKIFSISYLTSKKMKSEDSSSTSIIENFDRVILATGSSRGGYGMLKKLGHSLKGPLPSLFSFKIPDQSLTALTGLSSQNIKISLILPPGFKKGPHRGLLRNIPEDLRSSGCVLGLSGPVLITKQGLTGPAVLKLSAYGAEIMAALSYKFEVEVNWTGDLNEEDLLQHLISYKARHPERSVTRGFPSLKWFLESESDIESENVTISKRLWLYLLSRTAVLKKTSKTQVKEGKNPTLKDTKNSKNQDIKAFTEDDGEVNPLKWIQVSDSEIREIAKEIIKCRFPVEGRGEYRDEFVTCGGVPLKEVNFQTMESKVVRSLFLAGEVLNIDGITGGFNFQSAWTTGFIAGTGCANSIMK